MRQPGVDRERSTGRIPYRDCRSRTMLLVRGLHTQWGCKAVTQVHVQWACSFVRGSVATAIRDERPATVISAKARNDASKETGPRKTLARDPPWFVNQCSREQVLYGIHLRRLIEMRKCTQSDRARGRSQHHCIYIEADLERRKLGSQSGTTITKEVVDFSCR